MTHRFRKTRAPVQPPIAPIRSDPHPFFFLVFPVGPFLCPFLSPRLF